MPKTSRQNRECFCSKIGRAFSKAKKLAKLFVWIDDQVSVSDGMLTNLISKGSIRNESSKQIVWYIAFFQTDSSQKFKSNLKVHRNNRKSYHFPKNCYSLLVWKCATHSLHFLSFLVNFRWSLNYLNKAVKS